MKGALPRVVLACTAACLLAGPAARPSCAQERSGSHLVTLQTLSPAIQLTGFRLVDLDGDGLKEVLAIGRAGEIVTWKGDRKQQKLGEPRVSRVRLPDPDRTLLALADMSGRKGPPQLVAASPGGIHAYVPAADGTFDHEGVLLSPQEGRRRARFTLRTDRPTFADICRDVNGDGRPDVVLPTGDYCELWLNPPSAKDGETPPGDMPHLRLSARLAVRVSRFLAWKERRLSDVYESAFTIPRLRTLDVNGDGREDVLVEDGRDRAFHIQRPDGTIPARPDVKLNLRIFRDTTPEGSLRPGRTLAGGDRQSMQTRDLDLDGIPDYVIAHRRKIWIFHGTKQGPQFRKPSQILISTDDVTTMLLMNLDDDGRPDLVVIKVLIPTIASLILDALGGLDVEVAALGYRNGGGRRFETKPKWRSEITVKLPSLISVLRDPDAILQRFEKVGEKFTGSEEADLDGDGITDILKRNVDPPEIRIWRGVRIPAGRDHQSDDLLRQVLFEDPDKTWDMDRLISWLGNVAETQVARRTGGREPDVRQAFRPQDGYLLREFRSGDVTGDERAEVLVLYQPMQRGATPILDVLELH